MTLVNPKPLGWAFGELFTSAQANSFGTQIIRAIDGTGGGSYTLAAPLSVTGALVTFEDVTVTDDLTVADGLTVGGTLTANAGATVSGALTANAVTVNGDASFNGNYTTIGNAGADALVVTAEATFNAGAAFNANVALGNASSDAITVLGAMTFATTATGGYRFKSRMGTDTAEVLTASDACQFIFSEALTTSRTWTLSGAFSAGDWFWVMNRSGGGRDLTLLGLTMENAESALFVYTGANWRAMPMDA